MQHVSYGFVIMEIEYYGRMNTEISLSNWIEIYEVWMNDFYSTFFEIS